MTKDIIKEIIIVLLMIIALILIVGLIFYQYVPFAKKIPEEISYKTPSNVKEALQAAGAVDEDKVILTYELDQTDLNNYQRINEYKPGKPNPFSSYEKEVVDDDTETGSSSKSGNSSSSKSGSNSGSGSSSSGGSSSSSGQNTDTTEPGTVNPGDYSKKTGTK